MVRDFRQADSVTPVVLMGYLNPILSYGPERFCRDATAAGVDGLIVVDLPTEEADLLLPFCAANGLDFIRLIAPTTDDERLPHVSERQFGLRLLCQHHRHNRHPQRDVGASGAGDPAPSQGHRPADRHRLRRPQARNRLPSRRALPMPPSSPRL